MTTTRIEITARDNTAAAFASVDSNLAKLSNGVSTVANTLGALGVGFSAFAVTRSIVDATRDFQSLNSTLTVATGSIQGAAREMAFVRSESERLGLNLQVTTEQYSRLAAASKGTKLEGQATRDIFISIAQAATVLGLSADKTSGALTAIEQMISKGKVSAEELRGQLGERLPGAFQIAARAIGVTTQELDKMLSTGKLTAEQLLPALAKELDKTFGPEAEKAAQNLNGQINRFETALFDLKIAAGQTGVIDLFTESIKVASALSDIVTYRVLPSLRELGENVGLIRESKSTGPEYGGVLWFLQELSGKSQEVVEDLKDVNTEIAKLTISPESTPSSKLIGFIEQENESRKKLAKTIAAQKSQADSFVESLKKEAEHAGKTAIEIKRLEAAEHGRSVQAEKYISILEKHEQALESEKQATQKAAEALEGWKKEQQDALRIFEATLSVEERYAQEVANLIDLLGRGAIGQDTFNRALDQAREKLDSTAESTKRLFDTADQAGIQAARNIQTAFANMLSGVDADFGRLIRNMAAQVSSAAILGGLENVFNNRTISGGTPSSSNSVVGYLSSILDVTKSSLQTSNKLASSSESTATGMDKIIKDAKFNEPGQGNILSRAAGGVNLTTGALGYTGAKLAGSSDLIAGLAGGLSALGPYGMAAGATLVVLEKLNKAFGDYEISGGLKPVSRATQVVANPFFGAEFGINQFEKLLGTNFVSKALPGYFVENILGVKSPDTLIANMLFGRGPLKQKETTLSGLLGAGGFEDALLSTRFKASGSLFKSSKTDFATVDLMGQILTDNEKQLGEFAENMTRIAGRVFRQFEEDIGGASRELIQMGETLGLSVDGVKNFSREIELVSEKGQMLSQEQIDQEIANVVDELAHGLIPEIEGLARSSEHTFETIRRLSRNVDVLTDAFQFMGASLDDARSKVLGLSIDQRNAIINEVGGQEAAESKLSFFYNNILTDAQKIKIKRDEALNILKDFGINFVPTLDQLNRAMTSPKGLFKDGLKVQELVFEISQLEQSMSNAATAAGNLNGVQDAFNALGRSVEAERNKLTEAYNIALKDNNDEIQGITESLGKLNALSSALNRTIEEIAPIGLTQARQGIRAAIESATKFGNVISLDDVRNSLSTISAQNTDAFSTRLDFLRSQAESANLLREFGDVVGDQLSTEESSLKALEDARKILDEGFKGDIERLDSMLTEAQNQVNLLQGIDTTLLSIKDALAAFNADAISAGRPLDLLTGQPYNPNTPKPPIYDGPSPISDQQIRSFLSTNRSAQEIVNAAKNNNVSVARIQQVMGFSDEKIDNFFTKNNVAKFHSGGKSNGEGLAFIKRREVVSTEKQNNDLVDATKQNATEMRALTKRMDDLYNLFRRMTDDGQSLKTTAA